MRTPITVAQERQMLALPTLSAKKAFVSGLRQEKGLSFAAPTPVLRIVPPVVAARKTNLIAEHFCFGQRVHLFSMR